MRVIKSKLIQTLNDHNQAGPINCVTFSKNSGRYLLTGSADRGIRLFSCGKVLECHSAELEFKDASTVLQTFSAHGYEVLDIDVCSDNRRFCSVGFDRQVFLWDVTRATTLRRWPGHSSRVNCCTFATAGDDVVISGAFDKSVKIWDCRSNSSRPAQSLEEATDSVSSVSVDAHEIVSASVDGNLRNYDLRMGLLTVNAIGPAITSVRHARSNDSLIVATLDSCIRKFQQQTSKATMQFRGHTNLKYRLRPVLVSSQEVLVTASEDQELVLWSTYSGQVVERIHTEATEAKVLVRDLASTEDGQIWASARSDGAFKIQNFVVRKMI